MAKYLDKGGLSTTWERIKAWIASYISAKFSISSNTGNKIVTIKVNDVTKTVLGTGDGAVGTTSISDEAVTTDKLSENLQLKLETINVITSGDLGTSDHPVSIGGTNVYECGGTVSVNSGQTIKVWPVNSSNIQVYVVKADSSAILSSGTDLAVWSNTSSPTSVIIGSSTSATQLNYLVFEIASGSTQSDWNETSTDSAAYIKNKPDTNAFARKAQQSIVLDTAHSTLNDQTRGRTITIDVPSGTHSVDVVTHDMVSGAPSGSSSNTIIPTWAGVNAYFAPVGGWGENGTYQTPVAPTAEQTTNNTQIATTAFVHTAVAEGIAGAINYEVVSQLPASGVQGTIYLLPGALVASTISTGSPKEYGLYEITAVASPTGNPSMSGYYEQEGTNYVPSKDTTVVTGKTYYTIALTADETVQSGKTYYQATYDEYIWVDAIQGYTKLGAAAIDLGAITDEEIEDIVENQYNP